MDTIWLAASCMDSKLFAECPECEMAKQESEESLAKAFALGCIDGMLAVIRGKEPQMAVTTRAQLEPSAKASHKPRAGMSNKPHS